MSDGISDGDREGDILDELIAYYPGEYYVKRAIEEIQYLRRSIGELRASNQTLLREVHLLKEETRACRESFSN